MPMIHMPGSAVDWIANLGILGGETHSGRESGFAGSRGQDLRRSGTPFRQ
jgi:hypothetical protein